MGSLEKMKEQISACCQAVMEQLAQACGDNYEELIKNWLEIHAHYIQTVNSVLEQWAAGASPAGAAGDAGAIYASEAVVEVVEAGTGRVLRRRLPMEYWETGNGIRLVGETVDGVATHLAFLSETGVLRMKDILGQGPDTPRCE
ncbi:MAG TPA: hypothetical protein GXX34_02825 [Clostridia bacterium]|nr:hypothetical protein [Clostridia bacterium]